MKEKIAQEQKDHLLYEHLTLLIPSFGKLKVASELRPLLDRMNDCLSKTPFMYFVCASGVEVMLRAQMLAMAKGMFNKPYGDYSG